MRSRVELAPVTLPQYELPRVQPTVPAATYEARIAAALDRAAARGLDGLAVYGDREHFANIAYLIGIDPRWEEALLLLLPGRRPVLLVGNETEAYAAEVVPDVEVLRFAKFSLVGQPDPEQYSLGDALSRLVVDATVTPKLGTAGWKHWPARPDWIELPAFLVVELRSLGFYLENASGIFIGDGDGLRLVNDADQIAAFEFAACHSSDAMSRMISGIGAGMTELEATRLYAATLLPFSYHPTLLSGPRAALGVASAGDRTLQVGDPMSAGLGHWGANSARGGFLVSSAEDLPDGARDYVQRLVGPYFEAAATWYETIGIGVTGGELYAAVHEVLDDPFFGVYLNPGHHIHLDEWPSSPVRPDSPVPFLSGMALQLDIIPATGTVYGSSNIEDGVVLADGDLRAELRERYPELWARVERRREFLASVGIEPADEVLPMSNIAGWLPPYWLAPHLAMRRVRPAA